MNYSDFLSTKVQVVKTGGFEVDPSEIHPSAFDFQRPMIEWMLRRGQGLLGASFGLGKTSCQADAMRIIHNRFGGRTLIVCPLGARHQFTTEDGPRLGMDIQYVGSDADVEAATTPYLITNYERVRDGQIDPRKHDFIAISLDEGSTLRSLGSKTYQTFQTIFADVPYKFVATATPSPNEYKELIYYAQFLGVMDTGQALTRWFKRDSSKAGNLTLMPSHEHDFWMWVASWALFVNRPSDLGFSDEGYELPDLQVHWHCVNVDHQRAWGNTDNRGQARLILDAAGGVSEAAAEKRETLGARTAKMSEIVNEEPDDHWLIWHHLEDERRAIHSALPHAVSVYGSQGPDEKENHLLDFAHGRSQILSTKPRIAGAGCNFQRHCSRAIYLGIDHKFHDFIQSVHRLQRFQQPDPVDIHIIYAESEESIAQNLQRKWEQHDELQRKMQTIVRKYGLSHAALERDLRRQIGVEREEVRSNWFTSVHNDCVDELPRIESDTVGLIHTSIPFGNHYEYTEQYEDFGHNSSDDEFWKQMDFLIPELLRVLKPGRIAAIHVKDRILYGHQTKSGFMEVDPFSDDCVRAFRKHGFMFEGRRTIVTDVVRENASTYRLGWSELCRDATKMGNGLPEYLLLFRKPPSDPTNSRADDPVTKEKSEYTRGRWQLDAHSLWRSNGNHILSPAEIAQMVDLSQVKAMHEHEQLNSHYDHERHVAICEAIDERGHLPSSYMLLPPKVTHSEEDMVWDDIVFMRTLNSNQGQKRRENHICPLPLDIVERTIRLYSNEGDLVLEPFAGLHTVPYMAVKMGRSAYAIELNHTYWKDGVKYCQDAEVDRSAPTLFDLLQETI